ncbi:MAG: zinc-dependent peptidase [Myxococcales bacterium]|nr:zinc-dependent peptidase [Myxococcales bacterium]
MLRATAVAVALVVGLAAAVIHSPVAAVVGPALGGAVYLVATRKYRRRRRLLKAPFPERWSEILERRVAFYRGLGPEGRRRFEDDVRIFLAEQRIFADRGATLDDETRLLIAASAAMLCHALPEFEWPTLRDIVVYPRAFDESYRIATGANIAGMVHAQGPILFSQRELRLGFSRADGHNVGLHELAHVIDFADGRADGVPGDLEWVATAPWVELMARRLAARRRRSGGALRAYAGTNEAELFAVAVEAFFEKPTELRRREPDLYAHLVEYFRQDPAER